jgi:hypothetical protein
MTRLFEITHEDITQLSDSQLTDLLRRLLHIEVARFGMAAGSVSVALNINIPDGGEDGRIQWRKGPKGTDYLPARLTMFQCKAAKLNPTDCARELLRKRSIKLKPQVEEVLDAGGSYVLFTSQALSAGQTTARRKKMRDAIRNAGKQYADDADLHIYDANKIRDWTNHYIPAITAVCLWRGRPLLAGMQTWEYWSEFEGYQRFPFVPSDLTDGYVTQPHQDLAEPRRVARIVGLSGLGKTRLALEAFRPASQEQEAHLDLHHRVVYLDATLDIPNLVGTVSAWCSEGLEGILVVDNCDLRLHQQLQTHVQHTRSRLSLLTLDYNPDERTNIPTIRLEQSPDTLIQKILKQVYENLPTGELDRITQYAQGFPQMAVLLAKARLNEDPEMGNLRDDILLEKLLWGRRQGNDQARQVIAICALFEHVGFTAEREEEYVFVAKHIAGIDVDNFYGHIKEFQQRGVIDERGRYIRVVPLPLAVRLAADWWRRCRPARAHEIIAMEMPGGLAEALCDRVAKLDFLPEARELVQDLCGERGPFGQAEVLQSERGARLFRSLAETNPEAAAQALDRAFGSRPRKELLQMRAGRRDLTWTLEKLAFHRETFPLAARLLLAFAAAEIEHWSNNATGIFQQLFQVYLSGTETPPAERLTIIDEALASPDSHRHVVAVQALRRALKMSSFFRSGGVESQGSGPSLQDWKPPIRQGVFDYQEVFDYLDEVLRCLTTVAVGTGELAEQARDAIAGNIRGLVGYRRIEALDQAITSIIDRQGSYWPKALEQVRQTIHDDDLKIPQSSLQQLYRWEQLLQPRSIPERLRLIVSIPSWGDIRRDKNARFLNCAEERAQTLAEECARDPRPWMEHLQVVLQGEQRQGLVFGRRLGQCIDEPGPFINQALKVLARLNQGNANPLVLAAFLGSIKENHPELVGRTLDTVAHDRNLRPYLVELTRLIRPTVSDLHRILHLVGTGVIPIGELGMFSYGSVLDHLPSKDFIEFTDQLLTYGSPGVWVALNILLLHRYDKPAEWTMWKPQFRKILMHPGLGFADPPKAAGLHHWQDVATKLLEEGDAELARDIIQKMLAACTSEHFYFEFENTFQPVLRCLLTRYTDAVWPLLSDALLSDNIEMVQHLTSLFRHSYSPCTENEKELSVLSALPEGILLEWCQRQPTKVPSMLARIMPLLQREGERWTWTPLARAVIDRYGAQRAVLSALTSNLGIYSWSGFLVPYYEQQVYPLEQLRHHHIQEVRRWAGMQLGYVRQQILRESTHDAENELGIF